MDKRDTPEAAGGHQGRRTSRAAPLRGSRISMTQADSATGVKSGAEGDMAVLRQPFEHWETAFGDKVKQWRRERNWSQDDLSNQLRLHGFDMHQTTVAKIERGTRPLRVAEAAAIATIFGAPPLAVFLGSGPESQSQPLAELQASMTTAEERLEELRREMEASAARFVGQQADVLAIARKLNEASLEAGKETGSSDGAEA